MEARADQIEQRRLAGAVRSDDRVALALRDREIDAVDDRRTAEALLHTLQLECGRGHTPPRACSSALTDCHAAFRGRTANRNSPTPTANAMPATIHTVGRDGSTLIHNTLNALPASLSASRW